MIEAHSEDENQQVLVGCGYTEIDTEIMIVNPDTLNPCGKDEIEEIWVASKTVA